ncbi:MAG: DNA adenine methylase [Bacilli bacterium]
MVYLGSKNRISKYLKPIIESYITPDVRHYVEPFVGGANMIDKIETPHGVVKIGCDNHEELIELLKIIQEFPEYLPDEIDFETYAKVRANKNDYPKWYVGAVGFGASYGGRYFDGGYGRDSSGGRSISSERFKNMRHQSERLSNTLFVHKSYDTINYEVMSKTVFYCDPPYRGSKQYSTSKNFDHEAFYDWCRNVAKCGHVVLVSEYNMPEDFTCIWEKEHSVNLDSLRTGKVKRVERLFTISPQ